MFRVPWFVAVDDSEVVLLLFCLHVLLEVEVVFEFVGSKVVVVVDEVEEELEPEMLDSTGTLAFGAGVGIEA